MVLRGICGWVLVVMAWLFLALPAAAETDPQENAAGGSTEPVKVAAGDAGGSAAGGVAAAADAAENAGGAGSAGVSAAGKTAEVVFLEPQPLTEVDIASSSGEPGKEKKRNPFATTEYLEQKKLIPPEPPKPKKQPFLVADTPTKLPKMKLKGHLQGADNKTLALLEIEGGEVHLVREGDTVGLHDLGFPGVIRIKKIDRLHLVIESGSYGQLIIVR